LRKISLIARKFHSKSIDVLSMMAMQRPLYRAKLFSLKVITIFLRVEQLWSFIQPYVNFTEGLAFFQPPLHDVLVLHRNRCELAELKILSRDEMRIYPRIFSFANENAGQCIPYKPLRFIGTMRGIFILVRNSSSYSAKKFASHLIPISLVLVGLLCFATYIKFVSLK